MIKNKKKIIVSSHSGFCFGVKRALDIAENALKRKSIVYSFGPIIHNPQVVREFEEKGLKIIKNIKRLKKNASLLIPSHGMNPKLLGKKGVSYIDTTCPLVNRVQKIVRDLKNKDYDIIIIGDEKHPEVKGLVGIAGSSSRVIKNKKEARKLKLKRGRVALISQTTASISNFKEILSEITKKDFSEFVSFNTVCKNTIDRQKEARRIAERVGTMLIIGGKQSANTSRLAKHCKAVNRRTYHIESERDLRKALVKNESKIGIATGASTPPYATKKVMERIRRLEN